ncbi:lytic murein transglycosylase [bacterium]|nr:lytic murein transglycosylase [bacterium]
MMRFLYHFKFLLIIAFVFLLTGFWSTDLAAEKIRYHKFSLKERYYLINCFKEAGFSDPFLKNVFFDKNLLKIPIVIKKNIDNGESFRDYDDFHSSYSLLMAHRFSIKWRSILEQASRKFSVDKEVLVSILLVETGFGNVLGRYPVISVFSSIILENHKNKRVLAGKTEITADEKYIAARLEKKDEWARDEMIALLSIIKQSNQSPFDFKGSFAGAFGIPQFLPSSFLRWGYDSDNNGSVNLFLFPDAIYSTANYLKAHGWKKGLYRKSNKAVLYKYNRSHVYVDTVLKVAIKIKNYKSKEERGARTDIAEKESSSQYNKKS